MIDTVYVEPIPDQITNSSDDTIITLNGYRVVRLGRGRLYAAVIHHGPDNHQTWEWDDIRCRPKRGVIKWVDDVGALHREDGPALIAKTNSKKYGEGLHLSWYRHGKQYNGPDGLCTIKTGHFDVMKSSLGLGLGWINVRGRQTFSTEGLVEQTIDQIFY